VSVVDQRAWRVGVVRRLLLRAGLVLGGAFAATLFGWLLSAGSASAAELPSIPTIPLVSPVLPSVSPDVLTAAPKRLVDLSTSDVNALGAQAHAVVSAIGERVAPVAAPAGSLLPPAARVVPAVQTRSATKPNAAPVVDRLSVQPAAVVSTGSRTREPVIAVAPPRHPSASPAPAPVPAVRTSAPNGGRYSPVLPPLQPTGSPDSSAHGAAGPAGGSGGAQLTFAHSLGGGLAMADAPNPPRLTAGPGEQPGTSPD
jgi:hypothetical protein